MKRTRKILKKKNKKFDIVNILSATMNYHSKKKTLIKIKMKSTRTSAMQIKIEKEIQERK